MSAKLAIVGSMESCASTTVQKSVLEQPKVLAVEGASATNAKQGIMERLAQKSVHLAALHASWWTVLLLTRIIQDRSCHKDFAISVRAANGMGTNAKFLAVTAALEAHATRTQAHATMVAKKDGGETLVRTHAPLALWVAVTARMASHRVAALVLSQA